MPMFLKSYSKCSACLTNVGLVAILTWYLVDTFKDVLWSVLVFNLNKGCFLLISLTNEFIVQPMSIFKDILLLIYFVTYLLLRLNILMLQM